MTHEEWMREAERLLNEYASDLRAAVMASAGFDRVGFRSHQQAADESRAALMAHLAQRPTSEAKAVHPNHRPDLRYIKRVLEGVHVPAHQQGDVEAAITGMRYIIERTEAAAPSPQAAPAAEGEQTARKRFDTMRQALEIVAVGDSRHPQADAIEALQAAGIWRRDASPTPAAPAVPDPVSDDFAEKQQAEYERIASLASGVKGSGNAS